MNAKLLALAAAVLMVATAGALLAVDGADEADAADSGSCGTHLTWAYDSGTKRLTISGSGDMDNYNTVNKAPWAGNAANITSVESPSGMTSIGDYAFFECSALNSFVIKSKVSTIGISAFEKTALSSLTIPGNVETIKSNAFSGCTGTGSLSIESGVKTIGDSAFSNARFSGLFSIPDSVTSIGLDAFKDCTGMTALAMSANITSISDYAFAGCTSLTSLDMPKVTSIGNNAFDGCNKIAILDLPLVKSIGNNAFDGCTDMTTLNMPNVTSIGSNAFSGCKGFEILNLPLVKSIGNNAFDGCTAMTTLKIPNVTSIGSNAFSGCTRLTGELRIHSGVTSLGAGAFYSCGFTSLVVEDGLTSIPSKAFGCPNFGKIIISKDVLLIAADAFKFNDSTEYKFRGVNGTPDLDTNAANLSGHMFEKNGDTTNMDRKTLTVSFNAGGGTGTQSPIIANPGTNVLLPATTTFVKGTSLFTGWMVGGTVTNVIGNIAEDKVATAQWADGCLVVFKANNGTAEQTSKIYAKGSDAVLPSTTSFTPPSGMTFSGYWALDDGTVLNKIPSIPVGMTVYAVWTGSYTITYDANGGTGTQAPDTVAPGQTFTLPSETTFTAPAGKTFCGWALSPGDTMTVKKLTSVMENKIVYAIWGTGIHTVEFKSSGSGTQESISVVTGGTARLPSDTTFTAPTNKGFYGWSLTPDGSLITQIPNVNENKTVYAVWKTQWTVSFKSNGGSGVQDSIKAWNGTDVPLPSETDIKAPRNCSFVGWSEEKDGKIVTKIEGIDCNMAFYAIWLEDGKYRITLEVETLGSAAGPGGTVSGDGSYYKDAEVKIVANARSGFEFVQWDDGNLKATRTVVVKSDATYTAQFRSDDAVSHYVEFDTQGGSKQPQDEEVYEWEWIKVPDYRGTKAGYTFDCWICEGEEYDAGDSFQMGTDDAVFTAIWIKNDGPAPDNTMLVIGGAIVGVCALAGGLFVFARFRL